MKIMRTRPWVEWCGRLMLIGILTWFVLAGGTAARAAKDTALLVTPQSYDFGVVKWLGGQVQTSFDIHYRGDTPLKIRRIWTS